MSSRVGSCWIVMFCELLRLSAERFCVPQYLLFVCTIIVFQNSEKKSELLSLLALEKKTYLPQIITVIANVARKD